MLFFLARGIFYQYHLPHAAVLNFAVQKTKLQVVYNWHSFFLCLLHPLSFSFLSFLYWAPLTLHAKYVISSLSLFFSFRRNLLWSYCVRGFGRMDEGVRCWGTWPWRAVWVLLHTDAESSILRTWPVLKRGCSGHFHVLVLLFFFEFPLKFLQAICLLQSKYTWWKVFVNKCWWLNLVKIARISWDDRAWNY